MNDEQQFYFLIVMSLHTTMKNKKECLLICVPLKMALGFFLLNCRRYHFTMNTQEPSSCLLFSRPLTSGNIVLI